MSMRWKFITDNVQLRYVFVINVSVNLMITLQFPIINNDGGKQFGCLPARIKAFKCHDMYFWSVIIKYTQ